MVILHNQNRVERDSAAVITSNGENEIKIQGKLENIIKAKNIIDALLKNNPVAGDKHQEISDPANDINSRVLCSKLSLENGSNSKNKAKLLDEQRLAFHNANVALFKGSKLSDDNVNAPSYGAGTIDGSLLSSQGAGSSYGFTGNQTSDKLNRFDFHTGIAELKVADSVTDSSDSESDDEREEEIKKDPDYPNKVEFALKLGYSEYDLLQALLKLGATAGQNELLSELIQQGSSLNKDGETDGSKEPSPVLLPEESEEIQLFTYHRRHSALDDTTNLRPIVIDGSNVAMRYVEKLSHIMRKPANNKVAIQPVYLHSLISAFVVRCLDSITPSCYIQNFKTLASLCSWAGWFNWLGRKPPKTDFLMMWLNCFISSLKWTH